MFEIYKSYDANCPDVGLFLVPTEDLAKHAVQMLEKLRETGEDGVFSYIEGWEWAASWNYKKYRAPTILYDTHTVSTWINENLA